MNKSMKQLGSISDFCLDTINCNMEDYVVVALARKMPRLLEFTCPEKIKDTNIITERALPWLSRSIYQNKIFRFADDTINVGSTLEHYIDYTKKKFPDAGYELFSYALNEKNEKHKTINKIIQLVDKSYIPYKFTREDYNNFESSLPSELMTLGKPYDLDFPIINIPLKENLKNKQPEFWLNHFSQFFKSCHHLTTFSQRNAGITSITLILNEHNT
jgi:hypothetical protein